MNKNMVLEGNKMIAEFMGWKFIYKGKDYKVWNPDFKSEEQHPNDWVFATWIKDDFEEYMSRILRYHLSWDWLMPVIEKLNTNHAIIFEYTISLIPICKVMFVPKNDIHLHFVSNESNNITGLEAVFSQVVKFLKWHNAQKAQLSEPKV